VYHHFAGKEALFTIDLPLGAHPWPLSTGADRSATSPARLQLGR
jgi:hypothetical protein